MEMEADGRPVSSRACSFRGIQSEVTAAVTQRAVIGAVPNFPDITAVYAWKRYLPGYTVD